MNQRPAPDGIVSAEPIYAVRLLPDVREAVEEYAREQGIPVTVAIAEACRFYIGKA